MRISDWSSEVCSSDLAAFEPGLDLAFAGTGKRAFVAAATGLAEAGTDTTTDTGTRLARTISRFDCIETHSVLLNSGSGLRARRARDNETGQSGQERRSEERRGGKECVSKG